MTREQVEALSESEFRKTIVVPLLQEMGFKGAFEQHGITELGKDIVAWKNDDFGHRVNYAVVAKAKAIKGSGGSGEVATQVRQAFNSEYSDPHTGVRQSIHRVSVMCSRPIVELGRTQIRSQLDPAHSTQTQIMDINDLWPHINSQLNTSPNEIFKAAEAAIASLESPFEVEIAIKKHLDVNGIEVVDRVGTVRPKQGVEISEDQMRGHLHLTFPDTPEANAVRRQYERAMATGDAVQVPSQYVNMEWPPALREIAFDYFGWNMNEQYTIEIGTPEIARSLPVRISFSNNLGESVELPLIEWRLVSAGGEEMTFSNEGQQIGITVIMRLSLATNLSTITMRIREGAHVAPALRDFLMAQQVFAGECLVEVFSWEHRVVVMGNRKTEVADQPHDPAYVEMITDLAEIQRRTGAPIYVPDGEIDRADRKSIALLRSIYHDGTVEMSWSDAMMEVTAAEVERVVDQIDKATKQWVGYEAEDGAIDLFGQSIRLGKKQVLIYSPKVDDPSKVLEESRRADPKTGVKIRLVPGDEGKALERYLNWIPEDEAEELVSLEAV